MSNYTLHGGINSLSGNAEMVDMHGGVLYIYGNVGRLIHNGGVVYRMNSDCVSDLKTQLNNVRDTLARANSNAEYWQRSYERIKKEYDQMKRSVKPQSMASAKDKRTIADLRHLLYKEREKNSILRQTLDAHKKKEDKKDGNQDDVLVYRINQLQRELDREREQRKKDIEDLRYNLEGVKEAYYNLLEENRLLKENSRQEHQMIVDDHIDILASILALYPYTPDKDLEFEFGIPANKISDVARVLGSIKSKEERDAAREYLQRQDRQLVERRGGDQGNYPKRKTIEKVSRNGRVIATYKSIQEAAEMNNLTASCVSDHCRGRIKGYTLKGYKFRYKSNEDNTIQKHRQHRRGD